MTSLSTLKLMSFVSNKNLKFGFHDQAVSIRDYYSILSSCNNVITFNKMIHQLLKGLCILSIQANDRHRKMQDEESILDERFELAMEEDGREMIMKEGEIICQYYSFESLDREDPSLETLSRFIQYVSLLGKYFWIDDNKVISSTSYTPYPSLFECYFSFFTGIKEKLLSTNQQFIRNVERITDFLKQVDSDYLKCCTMDDSKRLKLDGIDSTSFEAVKSLSEQFRNLLDKQQASKGTENPLDSHLEFESLKTRLLEVISTQCSYRYISLQNKTFDPESTEAKMDTSFSQLVRYLHFTVPPEDKTLNLLDRYYLSVISAIRIFYIHAIQQACITILLNQAMNWSRRS